MGIKIVCPNCGAPVALDVEKGINQIVANKVSAPPATPPEPVKPPDAESAIVQLIQEGDSGDDGGTEGEK